MLPSNGHRSRGYALPGIDVESQWPATSRSWNIAGSHEHDADSGSVEASHGWLAGLLQPLCTFLLFALVKCIMCSVATHDFIVLESPCAVLNVLEWGVQVSSFSCF